MTFGRQIVYILGLAAALAAFAFAPSAAQAHAGHVHSGHAAVATDTAAQKTAAPVEHAGEAAAVQELISAPAPGSTADDTTCADRGCSANGHGTGCCGFVVPGLTMTIPPALSASLPLRDTMPHSSLAPEALRKPPRSFG